MRKIIYITLYCLLFVLLPDNSLRATDVHVPATKANSGFQWNSLLFEQQPNAARFHQDSLMKFKELAIYAAKNNDIALATLQVENYVRYSGETDFVNSGYFNHLKDDPGFGVLVETYGLNLGWINFFYLFVAFVGFYIAMMLWLKKKQDKVASRLISLFIFIHSVFIFHIFLYLTNLIYKVPHALYMSAIFSFLYGPLIYFYFKRLTLKYRFRKIDLLHLLPTLLVVVLMAPIFMFSEEEKLQTLMEVGILDRQPYLVIITSMKFASLLIYGYLVLNIYLKKKMINLQSRTSRQWVRNLVMLTTVYVVSYMIYGITIINTTLRSDFLFNFQIVAMATMVLYIGYSSYMRPYLFTSEFGKSRGKYKKSGLTPSFSIELKDQLLQLLETDKIYRQNDINLEKVSALLETSRHNTSQVINEHFGLNFFELINKYRIEEAQEMLKSNQNNKLNIIDIAYEVGFNNKVTFNKSFRKQLSLTPTQYLNSLDS